MQSAVNVALQARRKGNAPAKSVSHFCHAGLSVGGFSGQAESAPSAWADLSLRLLTWRGNEVTALSQAVVVSRLGSKGQGKTLIF